ncbi:hypothetical protein CAPTEDRAFT_178256 [Capitella teleta]|uniref:Mpv17-like protein n=1 Tax=Capitella teleta TaxID=283909 RepID=R7UMT6_CAPTE|nr:hypothetical protein CAPTEDRAFT_178256 [Capitella teleta]|eukprot:ELU05242.1 hypothetical protein CAPTEDRAFT_178256 [Capitella teleta]
MASLVQRFTGRHPLFCNMALYAGLYASGDLSRQTIMADRRLDWGSAARTACVGCLAISPFNFAWYRVLDRLLKGRGAGVVMCKVACDQVIAGPVGLALFFVGTSILEKKTDIFHDLKANGLKTYMVGCVFWPTMQAVNFTVLPTKWRTPYVGFVSFIWCNVISFFKSQEIQPPIIAVDLQA